MPKTSQISELFLCKTCVFQQKHAFFCVFFTTFVPKMRIGYEGTEMPKVRKRIPSG